DGGQFTIASFSEGALDAAITSGLSSAVYGTDFGAGFVTDITASTVGLALADVQTGIGDWANQYGGEGSAGHIALHALAGCVAAEAQSADCAAGAAGAIAQAVYAGSLGGQEPSPAGYDTPEAYQAAYEAWSVRTQAHVELLGAFAGYALSGGEAANVSVASSIAESGLQNNYLNHTERAKAETLLAELSTLCGGSIGPGPNTCDTPRADELRVELTELQFSSVTNTLNLLDACGADANSQTCQSHLEQAQEYTDWASGLTNRSRAERFNVSAAATGTDLDWGGNLDTLALDVFAQVQDGTLDQDAAHAEIIDRAISYDGRMNLTVGLGSIVIGVGGCALAGGGTACMLVAGGSAALTESNTIYDGAVTVITGTETDGYIQNAFEVAGYSPEDARQYERWVEMGLAVATFSIETGAIVLTSKSGQVLRTIDDAVPPPATNRLPDFQQGTVNGQYTAINPGPLDDGLAGTFSGGRYTEVVLDQDIILNRAGTRDTPLGQFFTQSAPDSVISTRIDSAVLPEWPGGSTSPLDTAFEVRIPAGTKVYVGEVSSQGGFYVGGTQQIVVPKPWLIDGVEVIGSTPLQ
ncbi:DUF637 domain-containing protein, partial [Octadecabacter sp. G9-8]